MEQAPERVQDPLLPPPPRRRSFGRKAGIAAGAAAGVVIGLGIIGALVTPGKPASHPAAAVRTTAPAPSYSAPVLTPPSAPSARQQLLTWWSAGGQTSLSTVSGDLTGSVTAGQTMQSDMAAGDMLTVEGTDATALSDAAQHMTTDAATALADPPPAPMTANWDKAMRALVGVGQFEGQAATAVQGGNFSQATVYLDMATSLLNTVATPALQAATTQVQQMG